MSSDDPILAEIVARLVRNFSPRRIVLFGSRARGMATPKSDYDLLVLVDGEPDVRRLTGRMRGSLAGIPASIDILVRPYAWWIEWSHAPFTIESHIDRDGVELHAIP